MSNRLGPGDLVVIAGGGISGLALAAALQSRPADRRPEVVVLERDPSFEARRQGYGVTLSETNAALAGYVAKDLKVDGLAAEFVIRDVIIGEDYSFLMDACALRPVARRRAVHA